MVRAADLAGTTPFRPVWALLITIVAISSISAMLCVLLGVGEVLEFYGYAAADYVA